MQFYKLKNPREGVKAATIAVRGDGAALLVVDFTRDPETGRELPGEMKTVRNSGLTLRTAKMVFCRKYQSLKDGNERPKWEEVSPENQTSPAQGKSEILKQVQDDKHSRRAG